MMTNSTGRWKSSAGKASQLSSGRKGEWNRASAGCSGSATRKGISSNWYLRSATLSMVTKQKPSPLSLNHVVLFAGDLREQQTFYEKVIGMRVTDTVPNFMTFLRCNPNHHSCGFIALPGRGLQHAAFDLAGRVELSEAIFHLGDGGFRRVDGPGRHGPGNILFTYFEDPEKKNLLELCTEIQQIDETSHQPRAWDAKGALNLWNS